MSATSMETVLAQLATILANFQGREYSGDITVSTWFFADLNFSSIDAVVLGEQLAERYSQSLPFQELLADLAARGATDVAVGDIAEFILQNLDS